jgi:hypothetical protein
VDGSLYSNDFGVKSSKEITSAGMRTKKVEYHWYREIVDILIVNELTGSNMAVLVVIGSIRNKLK